MDTEDYEWHSNMCCCGCCFEGRASKAWGSLWKSPLLDHLQWCFRHWQMSISRQAAMTENSPLGTLVLHCLSLLFMLYPSNYTRKEEGRDFPKPPSSTTPIWKFFMDQNIFHQWRNKDWVQPSACITIPLVVWSQLLKKSFQVTSHSLSNRLKQQQIKEQLVWPYAKNEWNIWMSYRYQFT